MRRNSDSRLCARLFTARVLARPGSPSSSKLPLASKVSNRRSMTSSWPMMDSPMRRLSCKIWSRELMVIDSLRRCKCIGGRVCTGASPAADRLPHITGGQLPWRRDAFQLLQALHGFRSPERLVVDAGGIQATTGLEGVLLEVGKELLDLPLHGHEQPHVVGIPADVH